MVWLAAMATVIASCTHTVATAKLSAVQAANAGLLSGCAGCRLSVRIRSINGSTKNARIRPIRSAAAASRRVKWPNTEKSPCQTNSGAAAQTATHNAKKNPFDTRLSGTANLQAGETGWPS